jgi:putative component of membrane protein insertase Oxa1/YidC/SpoIIIJ protein YidD
MWPARLRRRCLFRESCSHYVFRLARTQGLVAGMKALRYRIDVCNGRSVLFTNPVTGQFNLQLTDGELLTEEHINKELLKQYA